MSRQRAAELALVGVCASPALFTAARLRADTALSGAPGCFWGMSFIVVKRAFENSSPMVFSGLRFLCGLLTLLPIYARKLRREYIRCGRVLDIAARLRVL